jgi:hypothetical protein
MSGILLPITKSSASKPYIVFPPFKSIKEFHVWPGLDPAHRKELLYEDQ